MKKVYLVVERTFYTGRVYAIFTSEEDAKLHQASINEETVVVERSLFTGQANNPGYNR